MIRRLIILLLIVGCEEPPIEGCTHPTACNYDADATLEDESCIDPQGCNEWCEGDPLQTQELDCDGVCGGNGCYLQDCETYPEICCDCDGICVQTDCP